MKNTFDFEKFSQADFVKEIRTFMRKNEITMRAFAKMTSSSLATLQRLESGENSMTIETGAKFQKAMREFKRGASR